ncbi:YlaH-like family protein [Oceanobacillus chungangensis]|uniref:YlaH-like protein n=1 Tax=Oceanobacillus chungangensis TaxID=1229152 RepID=A0A3D8PPC6_9BACI|nr:YlaH-like family protein [Oceanobacillus chungangensis]RDW17963.1 hypothetical protein CWR45_11570 [Oceanobacillus chungangensis]
MSIFFDLILENNGTDNIFWIFYFMNLVLAAIAFKLGFARKLSLLKNIFVYAMLFVGTYIITVFSVLRMPMTESLIIIIIVLAIYRMRLHFQRKANHNA